MIIICPPPQPDEFPLDRVIAVGFGRAVVTRDGDEVLDGESDELGEEWLTGQDAEDAARKDPDHDWRIVIEAPLYNVTYQRQGREIGRWVLIDKGQGFA